MAGRVEEVQILLNLQNKRNTFRQGCEKPEHRCTASKKSCCFDEFPSMLSNVLALDFCDNRIAQRSYLLPYSGKCWCRGTRLQ